ncbi:MAG TPA: ribulose-phosphate 3-epimerase [Candidatus Kapabacteria bacterium]|nr:ribulose-phosphate 3-epimerase [Candidatus Kapabacteria bacterium]
MNNNHSAKRERRIMVAPSLLSADFARLENDVRACEQGGADVLHVDVMDGHFVPNITIGPVVVKSLRKITKLPLDCHLMIENADNYIKDFAEAGADWISVHQEACIHLNRTVNLIKSFGKKAGVVLNPATSLTTLEEIIADVDYILLMSVNPGFGGQSFIPSLFERARQLRQMLDARGRHDVLIEADGGIKLSNIGEIFDAGVDVMVSGSGVFGEKDVPGIIKKMKAERAAVMV